MPCGRFGQNSEHAQRLADRLGLELVIVPREAANVV
jgi:hypothetical protein